MMQHYPLILTGTIDSRAYDGDGIDLENRIRCYENSISRYIIGTKFNPVIFIENSGYPFDTEKYEKLAESHAKKFEFLHGTICNEEVKKHGKGYGDSLLIYEALTHSRLMRNETFFYKMTGRIFLKNSEKIIKSCKKHRNEFISYDGIGWVMTYLFKANKEDYLRVLSDVYLQTDYVKLRDMEICFWLRLYHSDLDIGCFHTYPEIEGNMGCTSTPYTKSKRDLFFRNIGLKVGIFRMKSISGRIFWGTFMKITGRKPYVGEDDT